MFNDCPSRTFKPLVRVYPKQGQKVLADVTTYHSRFIKYPHCDVITGKAPSCQQSIVVKELKRIFVNIPIDIFGYSWLKIANLLSVE